MVVAVRVRSPQPQQQAYVGAAVPSATIWLRFVVDHRILLRASMFGLVPSRTKTLVVIETDVERACRGQRRDRRLAHAHGMVARFKRGRDRAYVDEASIAETPSVFRERGSGSLVTSRCRLTHLRGHSSCAGAIQ